MLLFDLHLKMAQSARYSSPRGTPVKSTSATPPRFTRLHSSPHPSCANNYRERRSRPSSTGAFPHRRNRPPVYQPIQRYADHTVTAPANTAVSLFTDWSNELQHVKRSLRDQTASSGPGSRSAIPRERHISVCSRAGHVSFFAPYQAADVGPLVVTQDRALNRHSRTLRHHVTGAISKVPPTFTYRFAPTHIMPCRTSSTSNFVAFGAPR